MSKRDGGPAFPKLKRLADRQQGGRFYGAEYHSGGMTLRDWFAGQALLGFLAHPDCFKPYGSGDEEEFRARVSRSCYSVADAMLAAREDDS